MNSDALAFGIVVLATGLGLLGYTYALYPWLARRLPFRKPAVDVHPVPRRISVVMAARQPGAAVADKVASLLDAAAPRLDEIIVVLDGPDRAAREALEGLDDERLTVVEFDAWRGKADALNAGVLRTHGDILVMTDARQRVAAGAIARLVAALASPDVGAVSGALDIRRHEGNTTLLDLYWRHERALRDAEAGWDSAVGLSGALYAIKRTHWRALRPGLLLDDLAVAMNVVRSGARVAFANDAIVEDVPVGNDSTEFARKVRTLTGNFQYLAWNPWVFLPWRNRIWWQFLSHKVLRLLTPFAGLLVLVGAVIAAAPVFVLGATVAALAGLVAVVASRLGSRSAAAVARAMRSAMMLNGALLVAAANAFRGRWDVWGDPARPAFRPEP